MRYLAATSVVIFCLLLLAFAQTVIPMITDSILKILP